MQRRWFSFSLFSSKMTVHRLSMFCVKKMPLSPVTDPCFLAAASVSERLRLKEREEGSALVNFCVATEKVSNTTERWVFPLNVGHIKRERKRERKWAWCLSLDTGCVGACELKYQPLPFSTVKEWQPHDRLHTAHANTPLMHLYSWQNLHSPVLLHKSFKGL